MEDFYEHIDDYVNGLLEGEALVAFEREVEENASLKLAVENYGMARDISEGFLEVDMMETLRGLKETEGDDGKIKELRGDVSGEKNKGRRFNLRKWLGAASMMGVIMFAGWWVLEWNEEREYREYVLENYEWPVDLDGTKSVDTIEMNDFEKGKYYFERKHYEKSLLFLNIHLSKETDSRLLSQGYEWLGAVYLKQGKMEEAELVLSKSLESKALKNIKLFR